VRAREGFALSEILLSRVRAREGFALSEILPSDKGFGG
jgi:hypothetical protein